MAADSAAFSAAASAGVGLTHTSGAQLALLLPETPVWLAANQAGIFNDPSAQRGRLTTQALTSLRRVPVLAQAVHPVNDAGGIVKVLAGQL